MEKYHKQDVAPIEKENERDESYKSDNPQIDSERTRNNYRFTPYFGKTYTEFINGRIKELGLSPRKDAVVMNSFVLGSDKTFFDGLAKIEQYNFFSDCYKFFAERYGEENIIAAVVHNDESTPHMHLNLMPVTKDGRLCSKQLFDKPQLQQLQTNFYETVGKRWGLQRGKEGSQKKHLSTAEYKAKKIIEQAEAIREENQVYADALEEAKSGEIPRKRGRLQEQVIALTAENKDLTERLNKSMGETLEYARKSEKYADENHLRNVRFYVDDGFSGSNFERPDFKRMMSDVEDGKISTVIVKDMSRFGRDHILVGYYTKYYLAEADVRFIAIYDQVDSEKNPDDDITPFKNILNEMYAKDCSKKIKAVVKAKGNAGKHLASVPPLGYKKDPNDKEKWIIDEKGAEIVREIFKLCVQGFGPTQIARILTERGIDTPVIYCRKNGLPTALKVREDSEIWDQRSVAGILENLEYTGCTVNFKSYKKSYKSKKRINLPKEDWAIFENTQEAIIDKQTFETVQKIRQAKRRPTDMGEMSPLSGLIYCADCGQKMYLCRCTTMKQKEYFNCSTYRKKKRKYCTSHQITVEALAVLFRTICGEQSISRNSKEKCFCRRYGKTPQRERKKN